MCFSAVDAIMALRRAPDLRSTKQLDLYPAAEALNKVGGWVCTFVCVCVCVCVCVPPSPLTLTLT